MDSERFRTGGGPREHSGLYLSTKSPAEVTVLFSDGLCHTHLHPLVRVLLYDPTTCPSVTVYSNPFVLHWGELGAHRIFSTFTGDVGLGHGMFLKCRPCQLLSGNCRVLIAKRRETTHLPGALCVHTISVFSGSGRPTLHGAEPMSHAR